MTAYALVEPSGLVNPDSIMICGVSRADARMKAAEAVAQSTFYPATRDGAPVRKWISFTLSNRT